MNSCLKTIILVFSVLHYVILYLLLTFKDLNEYNVRILIVGHISYYIMYGLKEILYSNINDL